ncbi:rhodanese-like domain-containing protein [Chromobacterium sp. IIBBL 290-4]|uniref:rhodanese-like domain-containing protein n=1 Tax=Chromobacterium sp. IIBBL 290-4 TaxID=2953890 RepID=UPI0020B76DF6|nr:rhodanese-like domain-containing protein [Chromobacterium sp. IIBBL 290-4]UTH75904.1 rhodanese-like domain-containing protein [Chromobacterium sp. IIBBL 290-4]
MLREITAPALAAQLANADAKRPLLLDVREDWEYQLARIEGSVHIPMNLIPIRMNELPDDAEIVAICHHGMRSAQVALFLQNAGFEQVINLKGGIDAWSAQVDPAVARY